MTSLANIHKQEFDVYIGRAGRGFDGYFGNPYKIEECERDECLAKYKVYFYKRLEEDPSFKKRIDELKGQRLGCFCYPLHKCHGMIIIEYLDGISIQQQLEDIVSSLRTKSIFD